MDLVDFQKKKNDIQKNDNLHTYTHTHHNHDEYGNTFYESESEYKKNLLANYKRYESIILFIHTYTLWTAKMNFCYKNR